MLLRCAVFLVFFEERGGGVLSIYIQMFVLIRCFWLYCFVSMFLLVCGSSKKGPFD